MAGRNRWVRDERPGDGGDGGMTPSLPSLEATYLTDPGALAAALPPPLEAPDEPRVHARVTEIDLELGDFRYQERVGYFAVDAVHDGRRVEYPLLIPIDLESALTISRERYGEPKKLAGIALRRDGDRVEAGVTRGGVTFVELAGDVVGTEPTPEPYEARQVWFKFLPAVDGEGFDAGPFLVEVDQVRTPEVVERVDGEIVLRELATDPVVDLPVLEQESLVWTVRRTTHHPRLVGAVDPVAFAPHAHARYDQVR